MSFRSIVSLREIDPARVFVLQADEGPTRTSVLWKVWIRDVAATVPMVTTSLPSVSVTKNIEKENASVIGDPSAEIKTIKENVSLTETAALATSSQRSTSKVVFTPAAKTPSAVAAATALNSSAELELQPADSARKVKESPGYDIYKARPGIYKDVAVTEAHTMSHEDDLSCARILGPSTEGAQLQALYFGFMVGPILRVPIHIDITFGED
jgi:hypothetical protein